MALTRSELREKIMIILYQMDIYLNNNMEFDPKKLIHANLEIENEFVKDVINGIIANKDTIDKLANKYLTEWPINRLDKTGASILRMGIYELQYTDTPEIVVINEAVELSKKYSDESVRKIINAVLDRIVKDGE